MSLAVAGLAVFAVGLSSTVQTGNRDLHTERWHAPATYATVPRATPVRKDHPRAVGLFYFLNNHVPRAQIFDVTRLLAANPEHPAYGPYGSPHWWGEPWLGYYQSDDSWVIRKHMQMIANAGVDVIVFDNTNGPTYPDVYLPLCSVLESMKRDGLKIPQIAFFTGHGAWTTLQNDFYSKGLFSDLWYRWQGKPLMMVHLEDDDHLPQAIQANFSVRESWAWTTGSWFKDGHKKWAWLDNFPQHFGWRENPEVPEEISVSVAQHATSSIGRSSSAQHEPSVNLEKLAIRTTDGICFRQQFDKALEIDPDFIFVTGWNEWTATRFKQDAAGVMAGRPEPAGGSFFVDEYNAEFSRDIEPAKGLLQDNYYYILVDYVRRYKHKPSVQVQNTFKPIYLDGSLSQWFYVRPDYLDPTGDTEHRDHEGWADLHFSNTSGRNDIASAKVAYDSVNVSFLVKSEKKLTSSTDRNWMMLYLATPAQDGDQNWLGYSYVVNRKRTGDKASVEKCVGSDYRWKLVGWVNYRVANNSLTIQIPRRLVGLLHPGNHFDFKWADNILQSGEARDLTENGDVAPDDRFSYTANLER